MEIKSADPEFVRVWSRVERPPAEEGPKPQPELAEFLAGRLHAEGERLVAYRGLGLFGPAQQCAARVAGLRRGLFFLTGETALPDPGRPTPYPSRQEGIRRLYLAEGGAETDYRRWAAMAVDPILVRLLHTCADSCATARQQLWQAVRLS